MSCIIFAAVFSLIVVTVILSTSIEAIDIENHSVYASPSSTTTATLSDFNFAAAGDWGCNSNAKHTIKNIVTL